MKISLIYAIMGNICVYNELHLNLDLDFDLDQRKKTIGPPGPGI